MVSTCREASHESGPQAPLAVGGPSRSRGMSTGPVHTAEAPTDGPAYP